MSLSCLDQTCVVASGAGYLVQYSSKIDALQRLASTNKSQMMSEISAVV